MLRKSTELITDIDTYENQEQKNSLTNIQMTKISYGLYFAMLACLAFFMVKSFKQKKGSIVNNEPHVNIENAHRDMNQENILNTSRNLEIDVNQRSPEPTDQEGNTNKTGNIDEQL